MLRCTELRERNAHSGALTGLYCPGLDCGDACQVLRLGLHLLCRVFLPLYCVFSPPSAVVSAVLPNDSVANVKGDCQCGPLERLPREATKMIVSAVLPKDF